jgi:hypothetical protein
MLPTTWRGTDDVGGLVLGRLGDFDRLLAGGLDGDDAPAAAIKPDLLGGTAGQVDQRPAAHAVIHHHHHGAARVLHRHPDPCAQWQRAAGGRHAILMKHRAGRGAMALVMIAVPGRDPGFRGISDGRHAKGQGRSDKSWQAALDWHFVPQLLANL